MHTRCALVTGVQTCAHLVILEVRPFDMARHLGALQGRKPCIEVAKLPLALGLQPFDLGGNVDAAVVCGTAKVRNSRPQLRNGLFELKKRGHWQSADLSIGSECDSQCQYGSSAWI